MAGDHYNVLGVDKDAAPQDIKRAFRTIARECHPDVAGDDPEASERFIAARAAYETLIDPVKRARYDRRGTVRDVPRGSFFDAFYNRTTGAGGPDKPRPKRRTYATHDMGGHGGRKKGRDPRNDLDLDDLFSDFGDFGFGGSRTGPPHRPADGGSSGAPQPQPGADVSIDLEVPRSVALAGGTVTAVYYRLQRADSWHPGVMDPGVVRMQDIADVRIVPNTPDGAVLRERGLGDAGPHGGAYGDLVATLRLVGAAEPQRAPKPPPGPKAKTPPPERAKGRGVRVDANTIRLDVSVAEAMLGGRVTIDTPQGTVRISIPGGTSGGTQLRLRGKGAAGDDGPTDLYVELRIVVPKRLDDESRALIERYAELNPGSPRGGA